MFPRERTLRRVEERNQERVFSFGQRDGDLIGVSQSSSATIELPMAKPVPAPLRIAP